MAQHNVQFLEPQRVNACDRYGRPANPDAGDPVSPIASWQRHGWVSYYQSWAGSQRCAWQGCELVLQNSEIPLCYEHANRVWAYVDRVNSTAEKDLARTGLDSIAEYEAAKAAAEDRNEAEYRQRKRELLTEPGEVYYLLVGGLVKIGFTQDLTTRLKQYPPHARLLTRHPGTRTLESEMHHKFRRDLVKGREWFKESDALMDHIRRVEEDRIRATFQDFKKKSVNEQQAQAGMWIRRDLERDLAVLKSWAPETHIDLDFRIEPGSVPVSAIVPCPARGVPR